MPPEGGIFGEEQKRNLGAQFYILQLQCQKYNIEPIWLCLLYLHVHTSVLERITLS
jgi:hypothetical protein